MELRWTFSLRATAGVLLRKMAMAVIWGTERRWGRQRQGEQVGGREAIIPRRNVKPELRLWLLSPFSGDWFKRYLDSRSRSTWRWLNGSSKDGWMREPVCSRGTQQAFWKSGPETRESTGDLGNTASSTQGHREMRLSYFPEDSHDAMTLCHGSKSLTPNQSRDR